jgi:hypothetical protein
MNYWAGLHGERDAADLRAGAWRRLEQELLPQETLIAPASSAWRTRNQKTRMMEMPPDAVDISLPSMLPEVAQRNQKL